MSEIEHTQPNPIVSGEKLPGLLVSAEERPEGVTYSDQVINSTYGRLYYAPEQYRNGTLRWVTNHGEVVVKVRSGTGEVLNIDTDAQGKHAGYAAQVYENGMEAYQELKRSIEAGQDSSGSL